MYGHRASHPGRHAQDMPRRSTEFSWVCRREALKRITGVLYACRYLVLARVDAKAAAAFPRQLRAGWVPEDGTEVSPLRASASANTAQDTHGGVAREAGASRDSKPDGVRALQDWVEEDVDASDDVARDRTAREDGPSPGDARAPGSECAVRRWCAGLHMSDVAGLESAVAAAVAAGLPGAGQWARIIRCAARRGLVVYFCSQPAGADLIFGR